MFKSKVSCWFCNEESFVYFFKKNSWNCDNCGQYNGFNKDGDYNKEIPEMQMPTNKKFCVANANVKQNVNSSNFLCEKCNNFQELKLLELKNFEAKLDEKSEEEYYLYKKRLDQIYDLCTSCKNKLNIHLRKQDQQIGNYLLKKRKTTNLPELKQQQQQQHVANNKMETEDQHDQNGSVKYEDEQKSHVKKINTKNIETESNINVSNGNGANNFSNNLSSTFKKAYTIAGSVPAFMIKNYKRDNLNMNNNNDLKFNSIKNQHNNNNNNNNKNNVKIKDKITSSSLAIILEDMVILALNILVFICDFVNLLNDSDIWNDDQSFKSDDFTWFQFFLTIYKHIMTVLSINIILSIHLIFKRPKISRFLTMLGFFFSAIIHLHFLGVKIEEQYIVEVFISFFLVSYLIVGRIYNVFQLIRYFGIV